MEDFDVFTNEIDYTKSLYTNVLNKFVKDLPVTPNGPNYQSGRKLQAEECLAENDDLACAFHLSEAVSSSLRTMAIYRDEQIKCLTDSKLQRVTNIKPVGEITSSVKCKADPTISILDALTDSLDKVTQTLNQHKMEDTEPFHKRYLRFTTENNIENFQKILKELPKEWTVVQISAPYNPNENLKPLEEYRTEISALYLSVLTNDYFDEDDGPINVVVPANVTKLGEKPLFTELYSLLEENYRTIENAQFLNNKRLVQNYWSRREDIDLRMKSAIMVMDREWLGGWGCLLTGRLADSGLRDAVKGLVDNAIDDWGFIRLTKKQRILLYNLLGASGNLSSTQIKSCLRKILTEHGNPDDVRQHLDTKDCAACNTEFEFLNEICLKCLGRCFLAIHHFSLVDGIKAFSKVATLIREGDEYEKLRKSSRQPVILIVDELLDTFPWESLPTLNHHPVSRIENIHFLYYLYKTHEQNIVDGHYMIDTQNGRYVINPEKNLDRMENRMKSFVQYWCPNWRGAAGEVPAPDDILQYLNEADLFLYCGHGDGLQYLSGAARGTGVEAAKVRGAAVLSGCGSARLQFGGGRAPPAAAHLHYHIAASPLVIGMLWEVTDLEVDKVVSSLLALCVPSSSVPWSKVGKEQWAKGILEVNAEVSTSEPQQSERNLLSAVAKARRSSTFAMIASSVVARGLPVRAGDR